MADKAKRTTDEQRKRNAAYLRRYRREHPEKCRIWRDSYILRRAERLRAAQAAGGVEHGGGN